MHIFRNSLAMSRRLALFDLDNTLLSGDSDHAWGQFLISKQLVDAQIHQARNNAFYEDYKKGELDIHAYVAFTLGPVLELDTEQQQRLLNEYMQQVITAMMSPASRQLVDTHRRAGDYCLIITATNAFLTAPIAAAYDVHTLLATELQYEADRLTGRIAGIPCYQQGKVERLNQWLNESAAARADALSLDNSIFYSDSSNDLPLLEAASEPVVVNGDPGLIDIAHERNWRELDLHS